MGNRCCRKNKSFLLRTSYVRLGEGYSIVTEYTSFLVLENDGEYQSWKISRNNLKRVGNDRNAQALVEKQLEGMRNKVMADIGPAASGKNEAKPGQQTRLPSEQTNPGQMAKARQTALPSVPRNESGNQGGGTGPVGPLFLLVAAGAVVISHRKNVSPR